MSRPKGIYERKKNVRSWIKESGEILVESYFEDGVHFIIMQISVDSESRAICSFEAQFIRSPYPDLCPASLIAYQALKGMVIQKGFHAEVAKKIQKTQGCVHLNSLLREAADAVMQSHFYITAQNRDGADRRNFLKTQLKDICVAYSQENSEK